MCESQYPQSRVQRYTGNLDMENTVFQSNQSRIPPPSRNFGKYIDLSIVIKLIVIFTDTYLYDLDTGIGVWLTQGVSEKLNISFRLWVPSIQYTETNSRSIVIPILILGLEVEDKSTEKWKEVRT